MYEKLEECPSCKHPKFSNYKIITDHSISGESFALVICNKCEMIFTNPRPDEEHIGKFYDSEEYISHTDKSNTLINFLYKSVRKITLSQKINLIKEYTQPNRLLDFGCGTGTFLNFANKKGYDTTGLEVNEKARTLALSANTSKVVSELKHLKKLEKFDIITAWHVLEHVHDLKETLKTLRKRLTSEGYIFIALPNCNSFDAKYYDQFWAGYDVPRHLYHFTKSSFTTLAQKCKLNVHAVHPMKFDSFYVSMLSEKYKSGKPNYISAVEMGRKSNKLAESSGEYSSLIYVLTK